jgi:hypothetical protein
MSQSRRPVETVLLAGACVLLWIFVWYATHIPDPFYRDPGPVRALKRNRATIDAYIERLYAGKVSRDHRSYAIPQCLIDQDARYVYQKGDCIVISFAFICVDAVPVLIYSPRGYEGLPEKYRPGWDASRGRPKYVFDFTQIDSNWFYCKWDS